MPKANKLKIGLIQTTLNSDLAWPNDSCDFRITRVEELKIWKEIKKGFVNLKNHSSQPQIVILPELTIPMGYIEEIKRISRKMGVVIIGGIDFTKKDDPPSISNQAIVAVPQGWPTRSFSKRVSTFYFGKTFFSYPEKHAFAQCNIPSRPDPAMYVLDAGNHGRIGVAICSDFYDIERFVIYKGQIHHMVVIAHNKDINSYYFLCEAIARLVYCNVIICNTGYYGGSVVYSPYKDSFKRVLYKHEGKELFTTQVVDLPVKDLDDAQKGESDKNRLFKSKPPGYKQNPRGASARGV
jgi:predicted amidohydrolase